MKVGIPISEHAYTPESYAYKRYLELLGHEVQVSTDLDPNNDVNLLYMGVSPFWKRRKGKAKIVHEYQSLSTGSFPRLKNMTKKLINHIPEGRVFLNNCVDRGMCFRDQVPYIYRDMGVDEALFQIPNPNPNYDVVYCGSISGRVGLVETLLNVSKFYKVIVVGKISEDEKEILNVKNITLAGMVSRTELPEIYRNARFGLNFTPNVYPYNVQTSTKTLEYLASGLKVISNRYEWAEQFFEKIDYHPIWLNCNNTLNIKKIEDLNHFDYSIMKDYSWDNVLSHSNFEKFLKDILNEKN
ncbi:glycosyltransferase family protein [Psychrobacter pacificensis]|uniref:glycosyltransferase family protein n=1 Tax=Psychrobacter pacificensis TaxID=112002 RepID=UPI003CFFA7BB